MLPTMKSASRWHNELLSAAKEITKMKTNVDLNEEDSTGDSEFDAQIDEFVTVPDHPIALDLKKELSQE